MQLLYTLAKMGLNPYSNGMTSTIKVSLNPYSNGMMIERV